MGSFHPKYVERVSSRLFYIIGHDPSCYFAIDTITIVNAPVTFIVLVASAVLITLVVSLAVINNDLAHPDFCDGRIKIFHLDVLFQFYNCRDIIIFGEHSILHFIHYNSKRADCHQFELFAQQLKFLVQYFRLLVQYLNLLV
ncbi:hypothetical protein SGCOL_007196 [Colletotrichum sp. CLE4]